jgi:hypothetical protein
VTLALFMIDVESVHRQPLTGWNMSGPIPSSADVMAVGVADGGGPVA